MQKLFLTAFVIFFSLHISAQEIGVRFGKTYGNNIGVEGTIPIKEKRIHASVTFGDNVGVEVLYDFVIQDIFRSPDLRYYVGVGLTTLFASEFKFGVAGEVGLEYGFPRTPITIGLDYRPAIIILEKMDFAYENFGFNVRYRFK